MEGTRAVDGHYKVARGARGGRKWRCGALRGSRGYPLARSGPAAGAPPTSGRTGPHRTRAQPRPQPWPRELPVKDKKTSPEKFSGSAVKPGLSLERKRAKWGVARRRALTTRAPAGERESATLVGVHRVPPQRKSPAAKTCRTRVLQLFATDRPRSRTLVPQLRQLLTVKSDSPYLYGHLSGRYFDANSAIKYGALARARDAQRW